MRITTHVFTLASAALLCSLAAGQDVTSSLPSSETQLRAGDVRASHLLGAEVKRLTGDSVGQVEDLIVAADADVRLAVISVGGVLGVGGKTIALPFDQFQVAPDGATLYLALSEEELAGRPAFDLENVAAAAPAQHTAPQSDDFGARPDGATHTTFAQESAKPASALIGAEVVDLQASTIGKVNDVIVTAEPPEVQVIVQLDESLGDGAKLVAVPLPELTIQGDADDAQRGVHRVETTLTIAQLEALPQFQY